MILAGIIYPVLGKYEQAVDEAGKAMTLDPHFAIGYDILAKRYLDLGHEGESENALRRAAEQGLEIPAYRPYSVSVTDVRNKPVRMIPYRRPRPLPLVISQLL
jgi:tetratricopeptide (TPR) repeat protein